MSTFRLSRLSACLLLAASPSLYAETSQSHPPRSLETIDVTAAPSGGDYDAGMTTEGRDSYTTDATNTATRMVLSPRETPQSVTVITREQMEDFGLNSVAEVMQRTPGVTVNAQDTERLQFFARGFEITNFLYDGMPSMRNSSLGKQAAQADTFIYDRVEVLRGASGLLHGIAATLPHFQRQGAGHVITVASVGAHEVVPTSAVYSATKHAAWAITEGLRLESDPSIRVTTVSPGVVESELAQTITDPTASAAMRDYRAAAISPDAIAAAVAFAIAQPADVDVNEMVIRPARQR